MRKIRRTISLLLAFIFFSSLSNAAETRNRSSKRITKEAQNKIKAEERNRLNWMKKISSPILFVALIFAAGTFAMDPVENDDKRKKIREEIGFELDTYNKMFIHVVPIYIKEIKDKATSPGPDQAIWQLFKFREGMEVEDLYTFLFHKKSLALDASGEIVLSPLARQGIRKPQQLNEGNNR